MSNHKYTPGQRVRVNKSAAGTVAGFVGMTGHIGIGSLNAPAFFQGKYFVSVRMGTGSNVILRLPEECLDSAPSELTL